MAIHFDDPLLTAQTFLEFSFSDRKAELDCGVIRMVAGATSWHCVVQGNLLTAMHQRLRGTGYRVLGPRMAVLTTEHSVRFPDLVVGFGRNGRENDGDLAITDPEVIVELHATGQARTDLAKKLEEYRRLPSLATVLLVDTAAERLRLIQRTGPTNWTDIAFREPVDLALPSIGISIPHDEIFDRD